MTGLPDDGGGIEPLPPIPESKATLVVNAKTYQGGPLVMVDRTSEFGNPFRPDARNGRDAVIALFKDYFLTRVRSEPAFRRRVLALRGKTLGCWCKPLSCHAEVIAAWLDRQP